MTKEERLQHALHNERTCKYLDKKPEYTDWVITTAFYAALHFVQYHIFPFQHKDAAGHKITISNLEEYRNIYGRQNLNRHQVLADLLGEKCPQISPEYDSLKSICWTARYMQYQHSREVATHAKKQLAAIKAYCVPPDSSDVNKKAV